MECLPLPHQEPCAHRYDPLVANLLRDNGATKVLLLLALFLECFLALQQLIGDSWRDRIQ